MSDLRRYKVNLRRCSMLLIFVGILFSFSRDSEVLRNILQKLQTYHRQHPQEKLYLHLDKPFYAAGDSIWFKAYLVEASLHSLDSQSRVIYTELIDSAHRVIQRRILPAVNGLAYGDFSLSEDLHQGKYLIRAYTNYMKNVGEDFFFLKEFNVVNPAKDFTQVESNRVFDPDSIDLQFFAEGGNFVACGKPNRLAFKAMSPDGRSLAVEGTITDDRDSVINTFQVQHDGMGVITFTPQSNRKYYAQIRKPYAVNQLYPLPDVQKNGALLHISKTNKYIKVTVHTTKELTNQDVHLVVQSRGKVYYAQSGSIKSNSWFSYIPHHKFPDGISNITLFDALGRPLAERLVYQKHNESIQISIKTDTVTYNERQQVIVYADAAYQNGKPAQGSFSISVYDDKLLQSPEKYPLNINNYLSLVSDLKGHIENPGYYFKDTLAVTEKHLDLLMMVNGWRRFAWQSVLDENQIPPLFVHEKGIPISGKVVKTWKDKPVPGSTVKLLSLTGQASILKPDSLGNFYTDAMMFYDTIDLVARTEDAKGKRQPYKFRITPMNFPPVLYNMSIYTPFDASLYTRQQAEQRSLLRLSDLTQLEEVTITAKRIAERRQFNPWGKVVDVRKKRYNYYSIYDLITDHVPKLVISGEHPSIVVRMNGSKVPMLMINNEFKGPDNEPYTFNMLNMFEAEDVDMIEITKTFPPNAKYPVDVINLMVKPGAYTADIIGLNQVKYAGFYHAREFYAPRYDNPQKSDLPDKRTTLHWEPMLETDENGRVAVSFYTGDVRSRYRIVMEGITYDGYPGTATTIFEVK